MSKLTKVAGIVALASVTGLAMAGGYGCGMKSEHFAQKSEHCQMMKGERQGAHKGYQHQKMHHGKSCEAKLGHHKFGHHKVGNYENMSEQKREALMQLKVENKLERMTQHLNLSAEQQKEIRSILQNTQQKKFELKQQSREQIDKVLTQEQKQQREEFRQSRKSS